VDVPYFLSRYDPDPLRYYLTATAPETRDTEACPEGLEGFSWEDFVERNNPVPSASEGNELVATARLRPSAELGRSLRAEAWGNLANARGYSGSC
jgi:methionyl-tRNA synthetase